MSGTGIVTFDYAVWAAAYPELAVSVAAPQAQGYFDMAGLYLQNDGCSLVADVAKRATILNMITAHMAALLATISGNAPSPLVGRIDNASEGSVSVHTDFPANPNGAWFNQTKYGAMAWAALAPYRTASYIPSPQVAQGVQSYPLGIGWAGWR